MIILNSDQFVIWEQFWCFVVEKFSDWQKCSVVYIWTLYFTVKQFSNLYLNSIVYIKTVYIRENWAVYTGTVQQFMFKWNNSVYI